MPTVPHKTVKLGPPTAFLPEPQRVQTNPPAPYWETVKDACIAYPGQWIPVTIAGLSEAAHRGAVGTIKRGKLASFRQGRWDACCRDKQLYVRYLGEAADAPAPITIKRAAS